MSEEEEEWLQEENALSERVTMLCQMYGGSAKNVGASDFSADDEMGQHDLNRYEKARKEALKIAILLKDAFYRDSALHCVLDMCMKANDLKFATAIAKAITVETIQDAIVDQHGEFFVLSERDGRLHPTASAGLLRLQ